MIGEEEPDNGEEDNKSTGADTCLDVDVYCDHARGELRREGML